MEIKNSNITLQDLERFELPYSKEQLRGMFLSYDFIGYYIQDELVGILIFRVVADESTLIYLKVLKLYQNQGIGKALMEQYHRLLGLKYTYFLEVHENNIVAINLYEKMGYRLNRIRKNYYPDGNGLEMIFNG